MKYWSCCRRKTSDFNTFLSQEGCSTGDHVWRNDSVRETYTHVNSLWNSYQAWHYFDSLRVGVCACRGRRWYRVALIGIRLLVMWPSPSTQNTPTQSCVQYRPTAPRWVLCILCVCVCVDTYILPVCVILYKWLFALTLNRVCVFSMVGVYQSDLWGREGVWTEYQSLGGECTRTPH